MRLKTFLLLLILGTAASSCARFRVDNLNPKTIFSVNLKTEGLSFRNQSGITLALPSRIARMDNFYAVASPDAGEIFIFEKEKPVLVIRGSSAPNTESKIPAASSPLLHIPGETIAGKNKTFFAVNYVPAAADAEGRDSGYYRILHFSLSGELLGVVGRNGQRELAFESVLWFDSDQEGNLWVLHKYLGKIFLQSFSGESLVQNFSEEDCETALFGKPNPENSFCELMYPFPSGERVFYSGRTQRASESENTPPRFLHRTMANYDIEKNSVKMIFQEWNDPDDFPYPPIANRAILLWSMQKDNKIRLAEYGLEGNLKNNLQIQMKAHPQQWRSVYTSLSGKIFSVRTLANRLELIQWN